jgi:hypothetical protein
MNPQTRMQKKIKNLAETSITDDKIKNIKQLTQIEKRTIQ